LEIVAQPLLLDIFHLLILKKVYPVCLVVVAHAATVAAHKKVVAMDLI
jgi:hypothetical protein